MVIPFPRSLIKEKVIFGLSQKKCSLGERRREGGGLGPLCVNGVRGRGPGRDSGPGGDNQAQVDIELIF